VRPSTRRSSAVARGLWRSRAVVCGRVRSCAAACGLPRSRRFLCGPVRSSAAFVCGPVRSCASGRVRSCASGRVECGRVLSRAVVCGRVRSCAISCAREQILLILRYNLLSPGVCFEVRSTSRPRSATASNYIVKSARTVSLDDPSRGARGTRTSRCGGSEGRPR
jgi:hypothetical protein